MEWFVLFFHFKAFPRDATHLFFRAGNTTSLGLYWRYDTRHLLYFPHQRSFACSGERNVLVLTVSWTILHFFLPDNFVHRLIQNKTDGKLVQYGSEQQVSEMTWMRWPDKTPNWYIWFVGGAVTLWWVRWALDRVVWIQALAGALRCVLG